MKHHLGASRINFAVSPPVVPGFAGNPWSKASRSGDGQYNYFSINAEGSFSIPSALGFPYCRHFLYQFDSDTIVSRNLVKRFAKSYRGSIYVQLSGERGEKCYNTTLQCEPLKMDCRWTPPLKWSPS